MAPVVICWLFHFFLAPLVVAPCSFLGAFSGTIYLPEYVVLMFEMSLWLLYGFTSPSHFSFFSFSSLFWYSVVTTAYGTLTLSSCVSY